MDNNLCKCGQETAVKCQWCINGEKLIEFNRGIKTGAIDELKTVKMMLKRAGFEGRAGNYIDARLEQLEGAKPQ